MTAATLSLNQLHYFLGNFQLSLRPPQLLCSSFVAPGVERTQEGDASDENEEAEFFDAVEDSPSFVTVTASEHR